MAQNTMSLPPVSSALHRPLQLIGAACGRGAPDAGCAEGPEALRSAGLVEHLARGRTDVSWGAMLDCGTLGLTALEAVAELCPRLADATSAAIERAALPLVLTGDHSCAVGTWAGVSRALRPRGPLGLLWIDAHLDSHTPATSHSGALHGMPLAALLGYGDALLTECGGPGPKLRPQNVCVVGVRSFEAEEVRFLSEHGVRVFYMDEIRRRGLVAVIADALQLVQAETAGFGISVDLDAIDPLDAPGVGTPAAKGIRAGGLRKALRAIGNHPQLAALEVSEYNPAQDRDGRTARLVMGLLDDIFDARTVSTAAR
jgi:arginase